MNRFYENIPELSSMKNYPKDLFYDGDLSLLKKPKISIIGSRKPTQYSRFIIKRLSGALSNAGVCVVSGGAMGIDATAHEGAGSSNTIAVLPCGIDQRYPSINKNLLNEIQKNGLLLSQFEHGFRAAPWSFVVRNELVVALGDSLIVGEADIDGGSMRSVEFALKMKKEIYVLPQRLGESGGTNQLVKNSLAKVIYDIDEFVSMFSPSYAKNLKKDDFLDFCSTAPTYEEALLKFPNRVFEAELGGEIEIKNGRILLIR